MPLSRRGSPWRRWLVAAALVLGGLGCFAGAVGLTVGSLYRGMEWEMKGASMELPAGSSTPALPPD